MPQSSSPRPKFSQANSHPADSQQAHSLRSARRRLRLMLPGGAVATIVAIGGLGWPVGVQVSSGERSDLQGPIGLSVAQAQTAPQITSINLDVPAKRSVTDVVLVTVRGTAQAQGTVLLIEEGKAATTTPLQEIAAGVYIANVRPGSAETIVLARLQQGLVKTVSAVATPIAALAPAPIASATPSPSPTPTPTASPSPTTSTALQPVFTSHKDGDRIRSRGFRVTGQSRPQATVKVTVVATFGKLGGIISLGRETLIDQTVTADAKGLFQVDVPGPSILDSGTRYTIKATAQDRNETATAQIAIEQR